MKRLRAAGTEWFSSMCLSLLLGGTFTPSAPASDWGYDGSAAPPAPLKKSPAEQSAASLMKTLVKPNKTAGQAAGTPVEKPPGCVLSKGGSSINKPAATAGGRDKHASQPALQAVPPTTLPAKPAGKAAASGGDASEFAVDKDMQAARCWLQLFLACSKQPLDYTQQKRMEAYILGRERQGGKSREAMHSILSFWPKLIDDLRQHPEMEPHYADLLRALLRLHERSSGSEKTSVEASPYSCDAELISELLGMQRIAAEGNPPFSEDAVNAYADMAVFIYEQRHSGRTIDASDNRTIFAKVVAQKYNLAPTDADRRAMAGFDLAWAKFKIIWFSSDEGIRQTLLKKLVETGASSSLAVRKDAMLELVLANWPWKTSP